MRTGICPFLAGKMGFKVEPRFNEVLDITNNNNLINFFTVPRRQSSAVHEVTVSIHVSSSPHFYRLGILVNHSPLFKHLYLLFCVLDDKERSLKGGSLKTL